MPIRRKSGLRILAGRDDGMGAAVGDGIMAPSGVAGTVGGDAADLLLRGDGAEQIGQDGRIADVACGDLDGPNVQRLLVVVGKTVHWTVF